MDGTILNKKYSLEERVKALEEAGSSLPDYSTTEQKTGQKWIDGKDIYCKVVVFDTPKTINGNEWLSNVDTISGDTAINCVGLNTSKYVFPLGGGFTDDKLEVLNIRNSAIENINKIIASYTKEETEE